MSSSSTANLNLPVSISPAIFFSPLIIADESFWEIIFCLPSIFAWAMLPSMSYFHSLRSKDIDSVKYSTVFDVFSVNLPAHGFFIMPSHCHSNPDEYRGMKPNLIRDCFAASLLAMTVTQQCLILCKDKILMIMCQVFSQSCQNQ